MKIKLIFPVLALAGFVMAIVYLSTASPPPAIAQPVAQPALVPFDHYIGGSGLTEPNTENISVGTPMAGIVTEIYHQIGNKVQKGEALFLIDDREAKTKLQQAEAMVQQAEAELKNQQDQYGIINSVKDMRAISKDERSQRKNAVAIAHAKLDAAKADAETAQVLLDLHTVKAPIDGVVMTTNIRPGEFAATGPSTDPLVRMGNVTPMHIRIDIDENDAWRFKKGADAIAFVRGNPQIKTELEFVRVEPYVRPKRSLTGDSLERVDTRVLQMIYRFDAQDKPIYIGQQMDVYIKADPVAAEAPASSDQAKEK